MEGSSLMANVLATLPELRDLFSGFQDVANPAGNISVSRDRVQHILEATGLPVTAIFGDWTLRAQLMENSNLRLFAANEKWKWQLSFVCCKQKHSPVMF